MELSRRTPGPFSGTLMKSCLPWNSGVASSRDPKPKDLQQLWMIATWWIWIFLAESLLGRKGVGVVLSYRQDWIVGWGTFLGGCSFQRPQLNISLRGTPSIILSYYGVVLMLHPVTIVPLGSKLHGVHIPSTLQWSKQLGKKTLVVSFKPSTMSRRTISLLTASSFEIFLPKNGTLKPSWEGSKELWKILIRQGYLISNKSSFVIMRGFSSGRKHFGSKNLERNG